MSSYVLVKPEDLTFCLWCLRRIETDVATWGMLTADSRRSIRYFIESARRPISPISTLRQPEISVKTLREALALFEKLSSALHSARKVMTEDRRKALGLASQARKRLATYIQLDLFTSREP